MSTPRNVFGHRMGESCEWHPVVYGVREDGGRNVSVDCGACSVLVRPSGVEANQEAIELAERIASETVAFDTLEKRIADLSESNQKRIADLSESNQKLRAELALERTRAEELLAGKSRFFAPVVMVPRDLNVGWDGPVLLLDHEKLWRGRSLEFESVASVHREFPGLWVVRPCALEHGITGVLLDGWKAVRP